ncbi:MAG TPA: DUF1638 domain-containing protein [Candidatus Nanopelagicales bacterium]|nr:DUF1638 domain-containing protein [Candidatus Nanopelagicales bacterium]
MPRDGRIAVVACGALATDLGTIVERRGWPVDVHPLPPLLHNHPERIAGEVAALADALAERYETVAVGYSDCGSYGAVDEVCQSRGLRRLGGDHCYDVYAGQKRLAAELEAEPGTYLLTDFLAISFERTVVQELGLDRHPELREDYFAHYTRVVWLAGRRTPQTEAAARSAADRIGLPLDIVETGLTGLESELEALVFH